MTERVGINVVGRDTLFKLGNNVSKKNVVDKLFTHTVGKTFTQYHYHKLIDLIVK